MTTRHSETSTDHPHPWTQKPGPRAMRRDHRVTVHGQTLEDPYHWLRDPAFPEVKDPEILAYLTAENDYLTEIMGDLAPLRRQIYGEMKGRLKEDDTSVPVRKGPFSYFHRYAKGQQYPIHCRHVEGEEADETILLDENLLAEGQAFCDVHALSVSQDHKILAYGVDFEGSERYEICFKDLESGVLHADRLPDTAGYAVWAADHAHVFYAKLDDHHRPTRIYCHKLGSPLANDRLVYEEKDPTFWVSVRKSADETLILIESQDKDTAETSWLPADRPQDPVTLFRARETGHDYDLDHRHGQFYVRTNDQHENFRLVTAPDAAPEAWQERIPAQDHVYLQDVLLLQDRIVLVVREGGLRHIWVYDEATDKQQPLALPDAAYRVAALKPGMFTQSYIRLSYSALGRPDQVLDYDFLAETLTVRKQREIPSGFDPDLYITERQGATAPDGVTVPVSLIRHKDTVLGPETPLYLYVYGAYGHSIDPYFSSNRLSLLERGFVFAIAHVRGGSDRGRWWYENGKMEHKTNSFTDLIAVAEHLIAQGYSGAGQITISGGSAGGMTVGATMALRPALFKAVVAAVPFVDVLNTMLDASLPLTPGEYTEWGNPEADPEVFERIRSYSPYDQIKALAYPHIFASAGLSDPRVTYWEPAKWVAKLRATKTDENLLLLRTNMEAGHGGASGRFESLKELADEFTFLLLIYGKLQKEDFGPCEADPYPKEEAL